ncbi:hypothetical protein LZ31DRAFT_545163 [Colletotrichum somersetense]|nr:hypothetical protein LZ31DRAFT_545163 [Colletotrichum somersetense]
MSPIGVRPATCKHGWFAGARLLQTLPAYLPTGYSGAEHCLSGFSPFSVASIAHAGRRGVHAWERTHLGRVSVCSHSRSARWSLSSATAVAIAVAVAAAAAANDSRVCAAAEGGGRR